MAEDDALDVKSIPFADQILAWVNRDEYAPVKVRVLAKKLDVGADDLVTFRRSVKKLARRGLVKFGRAHVVHRSAANATAARDAEASDVESVATPATEPVPKPRRSRPGEVEGRFRRNERGFGFVRPAGAATSDRQVDDIFIPAPATGDAASGDLVVVRISRKRHGRANLSGEIVAVVERRATRFVGVYFERAGGAYAQIDGKAFTAPVAVGDPGAKGAAEGDKVLVEMVRFPSAYETGEGVVVEVLGPRGAPGVDTLSIIHEYHLPGDFPDDVLADAQAQAQGFDEQSLGDRLDLTAATVLTIDPEDARDFDDAISLERIENGHWRLGVHIADVAHFVRTGSPLDREARNRATSVYLPDRVIPMIPETVSNHLASLQPDRVRFTKTAFIEYTPDGAVVAVDLASSAIRSKRRFTYEEVDEYLAAPDAWTDRLTPEVHALLGRMRELAAILRRRRRDAGALELTMPEVKVLFDDEGAVAGATKTEQTESHQIIEEFMLAANVAVAERLAELELPFLRRIHVAPRPRKMKDLTEFVQDLGFEVDQLENRFELQRLLIRVAAAPEAYAVNYAVLRAMQRAEYSPQAEGHYALASERYCHFTSPIRRYPDLTVHRLIDDLAAGRRPKDHVDRLVELGEHCSERERRAEDAERELTKLKLLSYFAERIGEEMEGVITGVLEFGFFVQGLAVPVEGLVHLESLPDDYYTYDRKAHVLAGRRSGKEYRLGDRVAVRVARVDVDRRELRFELADQGRPRGRPGGRKPSRGGPRRRRR